MNVIIKNTSIKNKEIRTLRLPTLGSDFYCLVPVAGLEPARHCWQWILSYLLHTEYRRTQAPMEVVVGHQKTRSY